MIAAMFSVWLSTAVPTEGQTVVHRNINFDFNFDLQFLFTLGSALWYATDGVANTGYIALTDVQPNQRGSFQVWGTQSFIGGMSLMGVTIDCSLRIGGSPIMPAGGVSINFPRVYDEALTNALAAFMFGSGFANGPNGEPDLPEEGTKTGLSVFFDTANGGGPNTPGLGVRVDDRVLVRVPLPTLNGACDDPTSIQTGFGEQLCWQPLHVELLTNGLVNVAWKNQILVTNLQTGFLAGPCNFLVAAGTIEAGEHHDFDNFFFTMVQSTLPTLTIIRSGNELLLQWSSAGGVLQSADLLTASTEWHDLGTSNPQSVSLEGRQKFFRVRK